MTADAVPCDGVCLPDGDAVHNGDDTHSAVPV